MSEEASATMHESIDAGDAPLINDAIIAEDAGFSGDAGEQAFEEESVEAAAEEVSEEDSSEEVEVKAETEEELKEEIADAIEDGATEEEVASMIREYTLKVNGKEIKKTLDLSDEAAVIAELQKAYAGQQAMQKNAEIEKNLKAEVEGLLGNTWDKLREIGLSDEQLDELAENRLRAKVEELKKDPEQRERERMQRELEAARQELKRIQEEKEQAAFQQLQEKEAQSLESEITAALDAHKTLPQTPQTVQKIADALLWCMENGHEDATVEDVIPTVEAEIEAEFNALFNAAPEDAFERYIGKKNMDRLREKRLAKLKETPNKEVIPTAKSVEKKEDKPKKKMKARDYFKTL